MTTQLASGEITLSGTVSWVRGLHLHVRVTCLADGETGVLGWSAGNCGEVRSHLMRLPYMVWLSVPLAGSLLPLYFPGQPCGSILELQLPERVTLGFMDKIKAC